MNEKNTVNVVQEEDSSSARDNSFFITDICNTSSGLLKIINSEGVSFFSRSEYFENDGLEKLKSEGGSLNDELLSLFLKAVRAYSAELVAGRYLDRAEHTKFQLSIKLRRKGFSDRETVLPLDYLEQMNIIDDFRYSIAWLNTRSLFRKEGRRRLASELITRGVSFSVVNEALNIFFKEHSETEICVQALDRQIRKGLDGCKLLQSMYRLGFPVTLINRCLEGRKDNIL